MFPLPGRSPTCWTWPSRAGPQGRPHYARLRRLRARRRPPARPHSTGLARAGLGSAPPAAPATGRHAPAVVTACTHGHCPVLPSSLAQSLKPWTGHRWKGTERGDTRTCVLRRGRRQRTLCSSMPPLVGTSKTVWASSHLALDALPTHDAGSARALWARLRRRLGLRPKGPPRVKK